MQAIIIFKDADGIEDGGIFNNISYKTAAAEIGENNILFYIPLTISGRTYQDKKNDLRNKALEYQNSWYDFCGFSYFDVLTDNNFHTDTSIFNCYIAFGIVPQDAPEFNELFSILDGLKEIDRKSFEKGYLVYSDLENRAELDNRLTEIVSKY